MSMIKRNVPLPPSGQSIVDIACEEFRRLLSQYFRNSLAYPKCFMHLSFEAAFFSQPGNYSGDVKVNISAEGVTEASLIDEGLETEFESGAVEIGIPTAEGSVATPYPSHVESPLLGQHHGNDQLRQLTPGGRPGRGVEDPLAFAKGRGDQVVRAVESESRRVEAEARRELKDVPLGDGKTEGVQRPAAEDVLGAAPEAIAEEHKEELAAVYDRVAGDGEAK